MDTTPVKIWWSGSQLTHEAGCEWFFIERKLITIWKDDCSRNRNFFVCREETTSASGGSQRNSISYVTNRIGWLHSSDSEQCCYHTFDLTSKTCLLPKWHINCAFQSSSSWPPLPKSVDSVWRCPEWSFNSDEWMLNLTCKVGCDRRITRDFVGRDECILRYSVSQMLVWIELSTPHYDRCPNQKAVHSNNIQVWYHIVLF